MSLHYTPAWQTTQTKEPLLFYNFTFGQIKDGEKSDVDDVTAGFWCRTINIVKKTWMTN